MDKEKKGRENTPPPYKDPTPEEAQASKERVLNSKVKMIDSTGSVIQFVPNRSIAYYRELGYTLIQ
jgi:hypothetical protein